MSLHLFGIRHHGPGCARSLVTALDELMPQKIALEAPADAESLIALAAAPEMKPPVAMLVYSPDEPRRASYFPLAEYSPEWQAIRWAAAHQVPVHFIDLPQTHHLAIEKAAHEALAKQAAESDPPSAEGQTTDNAPETKARANPEEAAKEPRYRHDPLALFAEAAGYQDHELWWEEQIERRQDANGLFAAILEVMQSVRDGTEPMTERDALREAFMRKQLRALHKDPTEKVAVICGAWHAPVLTETALAGKREGCRVKDDNERLKSLPKLKTAMTWIPWSYSRMTFRSGYGAGVHSPGWYGHLWKAHRHAPVHWLATAARLLREKDLDASSASVIEAVRLAEALSAMRDLRSPGLLELNEAIQTVLCHGDATPMNLIRQRLEVGDVLGEVPADTPAVPLIKNLTDEQKRLRMKVSTEIITLDLDVRKENDLARSHLLHRLNLLDLPWGKLERTGGRASTFHEVWQLQWSPEFTIRLIEANVWGNTIEVAAQHRLIHDAGATKELSKITAALDQAILAGLSTAVPELLARVQQQAAVAVDVRHLLESLLPLARVARYGDVRGTTATAVTPILLGMFERAIVGLSAACSMLDDDAADRMVSSLTVAQEALSLLQNAEVQQEWLATLRRLAESSVHGLLQGWCCRQLLEQRVLEPDELLTFARLALSTANPPTQCAAWATGLLRGSGLLLLQQDEVWSVFDRWLSQLNAETFVEMLPLLRRAFADFSAAERRQMGEKVKHLHRPGAAPLAMVAAKAAAIDHNRARRVLPLLKQLLGAPHDGHQ